MPTASESGPATEVYRRYRGLILSGQLGAGELLPSVRQTARDLGIAPGTVSKAYRQLLDEGLLENRRGSGSRVAESAALLPGALVRELRNVVTNAQIQGADVNDVLDAFKAIWEADTQHPEG